MERDYLKQAIDETSEAYRNASSEERKELLADIERSFDEDVNRPDYARKLYLIENCIYGVDIQPIAIQISKLRFFISLVVDQITNNNPADNFGIRPLPNLEAKFVAANTLIGINSDLSFADQAESVRSLKQQLKTAKHKIFSAKTVRTKRKYKQQVNELRIAIANELETLGFINGTETNQLASWDMFDQNASSPFFDSDWMFGVKDGFDIVIGNPPYIALAENKSKLAKLYENFGYHTYTRAGDIYSLFYEKGWQLLCDNGKLCYITSNKWMRAGYGEKTRLFFNNYTNPELLIDFSGVDIFETATVVTNILLFSRAKNKGMVKCVATSNQHKNCLSHLTKFVEENNYFHDFKNDSIWTILSPIERSIKEKIETKGTPLKKWELQINRGILTGLNEAFIITTEKRNEILSNCTSEEERVRTDELIRPVLRGRDLVPYGYNWAGLWLIATFPSRHYNIEDYPAVKKYFLSCDKDLLEQTGATIIRNGKALKARKKTSNKWFELQDTISYWKDFYKPKVIYPETTKGARFAYDESGMFVDKTCFILISDYALYLQKTLSSKLFEYAYNKMFSSVELVNHTYQYNKHALIKLPVIKDAKAIEQITSAKEREIDFLVYKLYDLTYDEILIVDPQTTITREEYENPKI